MVLLALLLGGSSCDSFLDVQPKGEVLEDDLLKDAKGFENALYGVYAKMGATNLYGQNLSYSALDLMAQYYTSTNNEEVEPLIKYDYKNTKAEDLFYNIWCIPISPMRITCWNIWTNSPLRICNFTISIKERLWGCVPSCILTCCVFSASKSRRTKVLSGFLIQPGSPCLPRTF